MERDAGARHDEHRSDPHSTIGSWAGVLVGPSAWVVQLVGSWLLGEVIACGPATVTPGTVLGIRVEVVTAVLSGVLIALTVASGVLSYRDLRAARRRGDGAPGHRDTWLAGAGVMTSILFTAVIATSFVPITLIHGCGA